MALSPQTQPCRAKQLYCAVICHFLYRNSPELWLSGLRAFAGVLTPSPELTQAPPSLAVNGQEGINSPLSRSLSLPGWKTQFKSYCGQSCPKVFHNARLLLGETVSSF